MPHKQLSACFICLTICFFELYIIKKLVVSYKKPFWLENRCKFINADLFLQIFLQFATFVIACEALVPLRLTYKKDVYLTFCL